MRIVAWNCNMAFHNKFEHLLALKPDIAVISECADRGIVSRKAPTFNPSSWAWIGDDPNKGLGVFTFGAFRGRISPNYRKDFPFIAPIRIDGPTPLNLLAVWACHAKKNSYETQLGPLGRAIGAYRPFLEETPVIVAGDFNDNVRWDKPNKINKHSTNVEKLSELGLQSAYHCSRGVVQGDEAEPTIYWRDRKLDGPRYHIDYCFIPNDWMTLIGNVTIGSFDDWVATGLSDHVPLVVDIQIN